jgi:hypothetical protein
MPVVSCRLGLDRADAEQNRPVLVLRPAEVEELLAAVSGRETPRLAALLVPGAGESSLGASELPALRAEVRRLLDELSAARLPERLALALALQRLATACGTALEFGFNLYVRVEDD